MPNIILTPNTYTMGTLVELGRMLKVCRNMSTQYSKEFGNKKAKIGSKHNVRKPQRFVGTDGLAYNPEPLTNTSTEIKVDQISGVHFEWDGVEKTLDIQDARKNYFRPAASAIASKINRKAAEFVAKRTFNAVGVPGTDPSSMLTYLQAGDKLIEMGLPENLEGDLSMIINRRMSSVYVDASKVLYNEGGIVGKQMKTGKVADTLGYNWETDQTLYVHTVGSWASGANPLVNGANQTADGGNNAEMTLVTDTWTSSTSQLKEGDRFTIAGVNSVHPQTRQDTGSLQVFVVREDVTADGSGNKSIKVAPAITPSGQYQNVTAAPADNAVITVMGTPGTKATCGLLIHPNAFAFMSVPLEMEDGMGASVSQQTDDETGVSLTFLRQTNGERYTTINRFDSMFGFGDLYRELCCVVYGK